MKKLCAFLLLWSFFIHLKGNSETLIASYLDAYAQHERLSGTVLVQRAGETIFEAAYGCADYQKGTHNTLETVFNIGSISKQFTAAGILHLVEAGKIDLHGSINDYLGIYGGEYWDKVTVHHLLSHTSGIPSLLQSGQGLDHVFPEEKAIELAALIAYFQDLKLKNKPGRKYRYNNSGYVLLAAIIEQVSGQAYGEYLYSTLFQPHGLNHTTHGIPSNKPLAEAHYNYTEGKRKKAPGYDPSWYIGAGSIYSTVVDLAKWNQVIHSNQFLNPDLREAYFKPHENSGNQKSYAYGWEILRDGNQTFIHHDGTTFGYTCDFLYEPKTGHLSIILTNQTHESLSLLGQSESFIRQTNFDILQILNGQVVEPLPQLVSSDAHVRAGMYQLGEGFFLDIQKENQSWQVSAPESPLNYAYERPLEVKTPLQQSADRAVRALAQKRFWKFAREADGTLKTLSYLGVMRLGMNSVMKGMGKWHRAVLYDQQDEVFYFRVFCDNGTVDFSLHFNDKDKVQGVFDFARTDNSYLEFPKKMSAKVVESGLYLNGFAHGSADIILSFTEEGNLQFQHKDRVFEGVLMED